MKTSRTQYLAIAALVFASVAYVSYKIGHVQASREGMQTLAFVSLWSVKPSVQVLDYAAANPAAVPESIQLTADGSILMVARFSMVFDPDLSKLNEEAKSTLCTIAKNRELYRKRAPTLYDDALMSHLAKVQSELAPQLAQAQRSGAKAELKC